MQMLAPTTPPPSVSLVAKNIYGTPQMRSGLEIANWIKGIARSSRHSLGIKVQFPSPTEKPFGRHTKIIQIIRQNFFGILGQKLFTQKRIATATATAKVEANATHGACLALQLLPKCSLYII